MRINHNITALNTYNKLTSNNAATTKSLEKLSSGLKINRAGDNAAGLAISEKMRGQIRGLDQSSSNASDGISLIQTAEGALNETHSILQRMRELAVQSSNDTNTDLDREEIQKEIDQLTNEINRISTDTEFNTQKLLNGEKAAVATAGATVSGTVIDKVYVDGEVATGTYSATVSVADAEFTTTQTASGFTASVSGATLSKGSYTVTVTNWVSGGNATATLFDSAGNQLGTGTATAASGVTIDGVSTGAITGNGTSKFEITSARKVTESFTDTAGNVVKGLKVVYDEETAVDGDTYSVTVDSSRAMKFHIGANEGQSTSLTINNMGASALGVNALDLSTQGSADAAITTIDDAIAQVSSERAKLGAVQNRLEHTINNLGTSSENLTAAESRIRDVDMAKEMMEFTKNNILSQAAQSMLAQANQQPQGVLQLLQ